MHVNHKRYAPLLRFQNVLLVPFKESLIPAKHAASHPPLKRFTSAARCSPHFWLQHVTEAQSWRAG